MAASALNYKEYLTSAIAANLAYTDYSEIQEDWREGNLEVLNGVAVCPKLYTSTKNTAYAYSWIKGRTFYLTFRGTQGKKDILADIHILRTRLLPENSSILVHSGFLSYFNSLKEDILAEITASKNLFDTIHVTGHSLGGAMATIAAATIGSLINAIPAEADATKTVFKSKDFHKKRIVCHTVGSPRVGNTNFVKWFHDHVDENMRIANDDDPVTLFPISCLYTHVSDSICITDKCIVKRTMKDINWYWRLFYLPFEIDYNSPISDHSCELYIHRLMKLVSDSLDIELPRPV